jgi:hypothetical protein
MNKLRIAFTAILQKKTNYIRSIIQREKTEMEKVIYVKVALASRIP